MQSSRSSARSVSTRMQRVSHRQQPQRGPQHDAGQAHAAGGGRERVRRRRPGSAVPASSPGAGEQVERDARARQNAPSTWWFLPWMSLAIAPPTVTYRVPGVTGDEAAERQQQPHQPVEADARPRRSPCRPSRSRAWTRPAPVMSTTRAAGVLRRVAVGAAQPAGDHAAGGAVGRRTRRAPGVHGGQRRRGATQPVSHGRPARCVRQPVTARPPSRRTLASPSPNSSSHTSPAAQQRPVPQHHVLGRAALTALEQQRVPEEPEGDRDDRQLRPRPTAGPASAPRSKAHRQYASSVTAEQISRVWRR